MFGVPHSTEHVAMQPERTAIRRVSCAPAGTAGDSRQSATQFTTGLYSKLILVKEQARG